MEPQIITNPEGLVRIALEANASAEYLVLQDGTGASARACETEYAISLAEGAALKMVFLSLDGPQLQNKLRVSLLGRDAACDLAGLCLADGS